MSCNGCRGIAINPLWLAEFTSTYPLNEKPIIYIYDIIAAMDAEDYRKLQPEYTKLLSDVTDANIAIAVVA